MVPLAHSPRGKIPAQPYIEHITRVRARALDNARRAAEFYRGDGETFVQTVDAAATYHDLGKLDPQNQDVLRRRSREGLPVAHDDAGVATLLSLKRNESAILAAAHHAGLSSQEAERQKQRKCFRNLSVANHVDTQLAAYVERHIEAGCPTADSATNQPLHHCGFTRRVALSCLVDADHSDTARNYGNEVEDSYPAPRWEERLDALKRYVSGLPEAATDRQRNALRQRVFEACLDAPIDPPIRACDAAVGSGKTTSVMAHLLRVALEKKLRHIIVVLPYTNIIKQSVEVYRKALVLPGEKPEEVVAEHHHQADFEDLSLRQLATLWRTPIIVTTAVQFFETLASHHPAKLRKLHELPGSAMFVDETHAAIPSHLWPQVWQWLETWTREWGGHLVLASGSLPRFWQLREFVDPPKSTTDVPDLVPEPLRRELVEAEKIRITPQRRIEPLDCDGLIEWVSQTEGPRLVILNTVQSAAVVADRMRKRGHDVLHLSTALAPVHRDRIVERVRELLKHKVTGWTLVATSCVEAGMDFSFRTGFRESCSTASLIQVGGRVSRSGEHSEAAVWDFRTTDPLLTQHPGFTVARRVLDGLFERGGFANLSPSDLAKEAMRREITEGARDRADKICRAERGMEYPHVAELCRVIESDTRLVVIDPDVVDVLGRHEPVVPLRLLRNSVQIWASKLDALPIKPLLRDGRKSQELYAWTGDYDPDFLGYMAGVLPLLEGLRQGCFIV
ncbi:MAG: CRISPR-associated protein [Armatimonadetes bacterium]|nr:CRISPR-associated protein [Armatimonadota bacterium]